MAYLEVGMSVLCSSILTAMYPLYRLLYLKEGQHTLLKFKAVGFASWRPWVQSLISSLSVYVFSYHCNIL
jgi:hypothetical protein